MAFLKHSILALRILLLVLLASLVVFIVTTAFGVAHEREKAMQLAHDHVRQSVAQSVSAISISLWQYDSAGLTALLKGIQQSGAVLAVEVRDHDKVLAEVSRPDAGGMKADRVWSQPIRSPDGRKEIGSLRVSESYAEVESQIAGTIQTLMATELVKIIGLAAILFVIVYRQVARHLAKLAEKVTHLDPLDETPQVDIERSSSGRYRDELDVLVDTINGFLEDRSEEMRRRTVAENMLQARVSEIETTLDALSDGVLALDRQCRVRYANPAACQLLGVSGESVVGACVEQVLSVVNEISGEVFDDLCASVLSSNQPVHRRGNISIRTADGNSFEAKINAVPVPDSGEVAMILVFTDVSEEIRKERKIEFQAFHDPLTRLGNRSLLARDLRRDIEHAGQEGCRLAVLCLDLDNFKNINDALGHLVGDVMLKQLAVRFNSVVGAPGWVTRHGGDEFIVILPKVAAVDEAVSVAEELMRCIAQPFLIEGHELRVTSSVGISLYPDHGSAVGQLLSNADLAMYAAKKDGKNACRIFEQSLLQKSAERLALENGLRVAVQEGLFSLVFQPKVRLGTGRVDAVEALLRWSRPDPGASSPDIFIPVAEDTGLIMEIGAWVLRESLAAALRLREQLGYDLAVAVNVSPVQFRSEELMSTLRELARQTPDLPRLIEIELTETALAGDVAETVGKLRALKELDLKIAIDDFGTGYSSLAHLKNFPIDILKVDQAFIRDLADSQQNRAIVASVVQLARNLGFATVAEGVEEKSHVAILGELGCDYAQGYWFARPVRESDLVNTIRGIVLPG